MKAYEFAANERLSKPEDFARRWDFAGEIFRGEGNRAEGQRPAIGIEIIP